MLYNGINRFLLRMDLRNRRRVSVTIQFSEHCRKRFHFVYQYQNCINGRRQSSMVGLFYLFILNKFSSNVRGHYYFAMGFVRIVRIKASLGLDRSHLENTVSSGM